MSRFGNSGAVDIPYLLVNESQWKVETIYTGDYGVDDYGNIMMGEIESQNIVPTSYSIPDNSALWPMLYVIESPSGRRCTNSVKSNQ